MKLNSKMNMYLNFSTMLGGNNDFGALHLSLLSIGLCYKYSAALPLFVRNERYRSYKLNEYT